MQLFFAGFIAFVLAATLSPTATATSPRVIGGEVNPSFANAALFLRIFDGECTGALLRPNLIVTAAHCVTEDDNYPAATPADITLFPPGANTETDAPSPARVTRILFDLKVSKLDLIGEDIAYLVTDQPVGEPIITRVATQREVWALAVNRTRLNFVGYGQTLPWRSGAANAASPIPLGMTAPIIPGTYTRGVGSVRVAMDGVTGPCYGDSGGPWLYESAGELLLVGVESEGRGRPCDTNWKAPYEEVPVVSGSARLLRSAYAAAGSAQPATARTCIKVQGERQECAPGTAWIYEYCWSGSRAVLQKLVNGSWVDQYTKRASRQRVCDSDTPFLVTFAGLKGPGLERYRLVLPKQRGINRTTYDPFVVTSSS
jgi:secreted trypsin-like serine protease